MISTASMILLCPPMKIYLRDIVVIVLGHSGDRMGMYLGCVWDRMEIKPI